MDSSYKEGLIGADLRPAFMITYLEGKHPSSQVTQRELETAGDEVILAHLDGDQCILGCRNGCCGSRHDEER